MPSSLKYIYTCIQALCGLLANISLCEWLIFFKQLQFKLKAPHVLLPMVVVVVEIGPKVVGLSRTFLTKAFSDFHSIRGALYYSPMFLTYLERKKKTLLCVPPESSWICVYCWALRVANFLVSLADDYRLTSKFCLLLIFHFRTRCEVWVLNFMEKYPSYSSEPYFSFIVSNSKLVILVLYATIHFWVENDRLDFCLGFCSFLVFCCFFSSNNTDYYTV